MFLTAWIPVGNGSWGSLTTRRRRVKKRMKRSWTGVYPNPFRDEAAISFTLPRHSHVSLSIFDVQGRLMEELINEEFINGTHTSVWNAAALI
jgi:hypothetical protein